MLYRVEAQIGPFPWDLRWLVVEAEDAKRAVNIACTDLLNNGAPQDSLQGALDEGRFAVYPAVDDDVDPEQRGVATEDEIAAIHGSIAEFDQTEVRVLSDRPADPFEALLSTLS